ncbi:hypothetical protein HQ865_11220 [Mucilaginibacter mali]|uniref:Uncharacterized protein n=1 Tax=Mucilaginibacter mali TaxID=2740462 RepID=A0A7D4Q148_9SPHI|nr:hypothetical protein [Mucilaginibacter mali]QKJ30306.1 hypothetical protein HQ865_11220 [Mucilaginibacter mali]
MAQFDLQKAQRIIYLTAGYIKGELNFGEQQELTAWKNESFENRVLFQELISDENRSAALTKMQYFDTDAALSRVRLQMKAYQKIGSDLIGTRQRRPS